MKSTKKITSVKKYTEDWFPAIELEDLQSMEELYFVWWLCDLKDEGYVEDAWYESDAFVLGKGYTKKYSKKMKTKVKVEDESVLPQTVYTPDFKIKWTEKARGIFYHDLVSDCKITHGRKPKYSIGADLVSYVEIKPNFDFNNMTRYVKIKINWLFQATGVYVNLVKVPQIFKDTFVPDRYFLTDEAKKTRQIKFKTKRIGEFVSSVKKC